ncbi:hypothetical protein [Roseimaritima ulvae]|nr:hypothetical protein [Roseimaritima ulvae]
MKDQLAGHGAVVKPLKYGYLDAFSFWCPFLTRRGPIKKLLGRINDAISVGGDRPLIIIAHSFGTYAVTKILEANPSIRPKRLLLCGAIVRTDYRWARHGQLAEDHSVLNECADKDIWPVLAQGLTLGYGASGTFGFGDALAEDRYHNFGHSGYFTPGFVEQYWVPWIFDKRVERSDHSPSSPWYMNVLASTKWIVLALVLLCLPAMYYSANSVSQDMTYPPQEWSPVPSRSPSGWEELTVPSSRKDSELTILNRSTDPVFVYFLPFEYPNDSRSRSPEFVTPVLAPKNGRQVVSQFYGGCYYIVVREAREKGWVRELRWLDFGWSEVRAMEIKESIKTLPHPLDGVKHIPNSVLQR